MQPDFAELNRFLLDCPPFDQLAAEQRQWIAGQIKAAYVNEHNVDELFANYSPALYIVRSGGFDLLAPDGQLIERLESHDLFGFPSLLTGRDIVNQLEVVEDGIIYIVAAADFDRLRQGSRAFEHYFIRAHEQRFLTETSFSQPQRQRTTYPEGAAPSYPQGLPLLDMWMRCSGRWERWCSARRCV